MLAPIEESVCSRARFQKFSTMVKKPAGIGANVNLIGMESVENERW